MKSNHSYPHLKRALLQAALTLAVAVVFSGCTKAKLIGVKELSALKFFSVISISPPSGPKAGSTTLHLTGTGFVNGMTVKIGGIPCTSVVVYSPLSATCLTGSSAVAGIDSVAIVNGDGNSDMDKLFTYLGTANASVTRIAAGGNARSVGNHVNPLKVIYARTTVGAVFRKPGNTSTGAPADPTKNVTVRGGVIGVYTMH